MKLRHAPPESVKPPTSSPALGAQRPMRTAIVLLASLVVVATAICACHRPQRGDWHGPPSPSVCVTDADCRGGLCAIEPGASQGTCANSGSSDADGGEPAPLPGQRPAPNVQPSPNDIQL